jgi:hypothetical protein
MATVNDFLSTYFQIENVMMARREAELAEKNARINQLALLQGIRQQMVGAQPIADLAQFGQDQLGLQGNIGGMLQGTVPGQGAVGRSLESEGLQGLDPTRRGQIGEEAVTRAGAGQSSFGLNSEQFLDSLLNPRALADETFDEISAEFMSRLGTGQGLGQLSMSSALSQLTPEERQMGAGINMGTRLSAGEMQQGEIAAQGARLNWAQLAQTGALAEADLTLRAGANEMNQRLGLLKMQIDSTGDVDAAATLLNITSLLRNMEQNKAMSKIEAEMYLKTLQNEFDRLRGAGYEAPNWEGITPDDLSGENPLIGAITSWWERQKEGMNR